MSYGSLKNFAFCYDGPQDQIASAPGGGIYHGSRTTPGKHGALQSLLFSHLDSTHHDVKLTTEQKRRITYWLDCCSMELGAYTRVGDQQAGKLVWPELDCDTANPQGVEIAFPSPGATTIQGGGVHFLSDQPLEMRINGTVISLANPHRVDIRMSLFDMAGRCVYSKIFRQHADRLSVDARNWPRARGIYIVKAFVEKSSASLIAPMVY
jgi:hypothetical protein